LEDKNKIFINKTMSPINPVSLTMEYILKTAIQENKMELIQPSREYTEVEVAYIKGYIQSLEDMLYELMLLNEEDLDFTYKYSLN